LGGGPAVAGRRPVPAIADEDFIELRTAAEKRFWFWQAAVECGACLVSLIENCRPALSPAKPESPNAIASH